jgi:hypothetical protein
VNSQRVVERQVLSDAGLSLAQIKHVIISDTVAEKILECICQKAELYMDDKIEKRKSVRVKTGLITLTKPLMTGSLKENMATTPSISKQVPVRSAGRKATYVASEYMTRSPIQIAAQLSL